MSIHAQLSNDAKAKLKSQQIKSTISAVIVSLLVFALLILGLAFIFLHTISKKNADIISFSPPSIIDNPIEKPEVVNQVERKPSAPSSTTTRVIASTSTSNLSIPVPTLDVAEPSLEFGDGNEFGEGWGDGSGEGTGSGGSGGLFGSSGGNNNRLQGYIYDLTQTKYGKASKYLPRYVPNDNCPWQDPFVSSIMRGGIKDTELNKFYRGPQKLGVHQIMIPRSDANAAPKAFGAEGKMKPGAWLIVYRGKVKSPVSGQIRFCGTADNYIGVRFQTRNVLYYASGSHSTYKLSEVKPTPGLRMPIAYGDWINVREGSWYDISVLIGDAGGLFSGLLYYEVKGQEGSKYLFHTEDLPYDDVMTLDQKAGGATRDIPSDLNPESPVWECKSY